MIIIKIVLVLLLISSNYENRHAAQFKMDAFETMINDLSTMLSNCKRREMDNIGIITHSKSSMAWSSIFLHRSTVINLKDTQTKGQFAWDVHRRLLRQKLHVFIIVASSPGNLRYLINELKKTIWWNKQALFILIDGQTLKNGCKHSYQYLSASWTEELISATYFCRHPTKGPTMYTYNPYIREAPRPWKVVGTNTMNRNNHTWTLLEQPFRSGHTTCKDLDFDKQTDLGGFPLNLIGIELSGFLTFNLSRQNVGLEMIGGFDGMVGRAIFEKLNATVKFDPIFSYEEGGTYMHKLISGEYDMLITTAYIFNKQMLSMTYPHVDSGLSILTRYPGYETAYTKILKFMNPKLMLGILLVFTGTIIVLRMFAHKEIMIAVLEVLRIVFGVSLLNVPTGNPLRIYLFTVIVLFMLTASIFQSNLSSLLTSPVPKSPINSESELKESGFPLYLHQSHQNAIYDDVLRSRMITTDTWDCSDYVMNNEDVACAMERIGLQKIAQDKNLYTSKHRISTLYCAYIVRPNWSLMNKINSMLNVFYERGLINHWYDMVTARYNYKANRIKEEFEKKEFRILQLQDITFAFYILLFGNTVAFLVFLIEICFARYTTMNKMKRIKKLPVFPFTH